MTTRIRARFTALRRAVRMVVCGNCSTEYPASETICPGCGLGDGQ